MPGSPALSGLPTGWEVAAPSGPRFSNFNQAGGLLVGDAVCADGTSGTTVAIVSSPVWARAAGALTVRVAASLQVLTPGGAVSLYPRWTDAANYYVFTLDTGVGLMTLGGAVSGSPLALCTSVLSGVPPPNASVWYAVSVDVGPDGSIVASVNGSVVCRALSTAVPWGGAGLGMPFGSAILADDFSVSTVDPVCATGCANLTAGKACALACAPGLVAMGGDAARSCRADGSLSGLPLVCGVPAPRVVNVSATVRELTPVGTLVGVVNASMPALAASSSSSTSSAGQLLFSITGGNVGSAFAIEACSGAVSVLTPSAIDFEALGGAQRFFTLAVLAYVAGSVPLSSSSGYMLIAVSDANDPPVLSVAPPGACTVPENSPVNTSVCGLAVFDPDSLNAVSAYWPTTYAYTVAAAYGAAGTMFALGATTGALTVRSPSLDYEAAAAYTMTVVATDARDATSASAPLTLGIAITNVNERE